jgi:hypothetical protein
MGTINQSFAKRTTYNLLLKEATSLLEITEGQALDEEDERGLIS